MKFAQGERVSHPNKPDWGIGQVLNDSDGDDVRVFFVGIGEKSLKLQYANLIPVQGQEAKNTILDNLKIVQKGGTTKYKSLSLLIDNFLRTFPDGFYGESYNRHERDYKLKAHRLMVSSLDKENYDSLLASYDYSEICKRVLAVVNKTNLIFPNEKMSLKDGLKSEPNMRLFCESLYGLLYGEGDLESRFNPFADCLIEMKSSKWTVLSYFLFITFPSKHMFLKPGVTQRAAAICGFELNYRPELNWLTYSKLAEFSQHLFKELSVLKPRDMIDIQSFIWCTAKIDEGGYDAS
jgi:hypothetical protein